MFLVLHDFRKPHPAPRFAGVTLIEMAITLAVLAVLLGLAIPSFQEAIRSSRARGVANEFAATINFARSEAVKRGRNVTLCKVDSAEAATPVCTTSGDWSSGWMVFMDGTTLGTFDATATAPEVADVRIRIGKPSATGLTFSGGSSYSNFVTFLPTGGHRGNNDATKVSGSFVICAQGISRTLDVSLIGRVHISRGTC